MMYEINCSEKERSLIRTTGSLLWCVFVLIFSFLIRVMEAVTVLCRSFKMQGFI